jgi:ABC-type glycerol-3-phosphate transport system substrate-binding protein
LQIFPRTLTKFAGETISYKDIVKTYEAKHPGTSIQVTHKSYEETAAAVQQAEGMQKFVSALALALLSGKGKHDPAKLDNKEYPEWKPKGFANIF